MARKVQLGQAVVYHDERGVPHDALVTTVWGEGDEPHLCVNLLWVSGDENRKDDYGRQIERQSSVVRMGEHSAHGNYWRFHDEEPVPYREPGQA